MRPISVLSILAGLSLVACAPARAPALFPSGGPGALPEMPPRLAPVVITPNEAPPSAPVLPPTLGTLLRAPAPPLGETKREEERPTRVSLSTARCPAEMALVGGSVCIDRWEDSIVLFEDGKEHLHSPYEPVDHLESYRAVSRGGVIPQGYISGKEAEVACQASGKRLCTPIEWERGCRGPDHLQFPYGNERRAHVCNDDVRKAHPVMEAAAKMHIPKDQMWSKGMNLAIINQLPDTLLKTGERSECVTPEGLYDMVGNLHEWLADATFHGGYYMDTTHNGDGCSYQTSAHAFGYHDYSTGFRCCSDPDPIE